MRRGLPVAIAVSLIAAGTVMVVQHSRRGYHSTDGARLVRFSLASEATHRTLHELLVVPRRHGRTMLVLLHDSGSSKLLSQRLFDGLEDLGSRAPTVLLLDGGTGCRWEATALHEAIAAGVARTHAARVVIGAHEKQYRRLAADACG